MSDTDLKEFVEGLIAEQRAMCARFGVDLAPALPELKLGISRDLLEHPRGQYPIHGLRNSPSATTTGWYLWAGELSRDDDFFLPLHAGHIWRSHRFLLPYLGLPPGWRFLVAPGYEDVWYDDQVATTQG